MTRAPSKAVTYAAQAKKWADGFGSTLPLEVGKQGRNKMKARLEKHAAAQEEDEEDWFAGRGGTGQKPPLISRLALEEHKKLAFGTINRDSGRYGRNDKEGGRRDRNRDRDRNRNRDGRPRYDDLPTPVRETDSLQIRGASRRLARDNQDRYDGSIRGAASRSERDRDGDKRDGYDSKKDGSRHRDRERRRDRDRDRDGRGLSPQREREPRYRGGYAR